MINETAYRRCEYCCFCGFEYKMRLYENILKPAKGAMFGPFCEIRKNQTNYTWRYVCEECILHIVEDSIKKHLWDDKKKILKLRRRNLKKKCK